ncbi:TolC family protein [Longimicrobium sp.]|uniref:TolC family protein n=1 Tax=Longimicrobium sp. TaxID=2029185 RepID=UPI002BC42CD5|nr:TolC family protein [Longimicrobium sp.]HSU16650.1 TolC family protein [Longimicrobium sp.]
MTSMNPRSAAASAALALALAVAPAAAQQTTPRAQPTPPPPPPVQAQPAGPPLSMEQAVASAQENNPDLLQQKNDTRSARAAVRESRLDFLPSASVSGGLGYTAPGEQRVGSVQLRQTSPAYYSSFYSLDLNYSLSGAKLMQPRVARAQERATQQRVTGYEANLVSTVRQNYLATLQAWEQAQQAERELGRTQEHERLARARLDVGAGTPLDLRRAEVQRGQAEVALVQRRNDYQTALLRLGQVMGRELPADTRLSSTFGLFEPRWTVDELEAMALAGNPNLLSARATAQAARTGVRAARTQYLPSLSMSVGYRGSVYSASDLSSFYEQELSIKQGQFESCNYNNQLGALIGAGQLDCSKYDVSNPAVANAVRSGVRAQNPTFPFGFKTQPLQASLALSLPLFNGYQRERQVEEARVQAEDADLAVRSTELRLRADLGAALLATQTAFRTAQLQDQVVDRATEELRLAQERFRFGVASSVEVTDAQTSLSQAEQARIDAVYNYHKSLAALEALVGRPLRQPGS